MRDLLTMFSPAAVRGVLRQASAGVGHGLAPGICGHERLRSATVFQPTDSSRQRRGCGRLSRPGSRSERRLGRVLRPSDFLPSVCPSEVVAEQCAAANCSGRSQPLLPPPSPPAIFPQRLRPPSAVAELGSLGDFAHLFLRTTPTEAFLTSMPSTKLHGLKTASARVYRDFRALAFGSFKSIEQPAFAELAIRESAASSTASLLGVHREAGTSRRFTRSSFERIDRAAVMGFPPLHAPGEFQLSRHLRSGIYRESGRYSRNSFLNVCPEQPSPNHALQRTAPRVTLAAACHPAACAHPAPAAFPQPARRAPQSLSVGALGAKTHAE